jgi:hypothetical protein
VSFNVNFIQPCKFSMLRCINICMIGYYQLEMAFYCKLQTGYVIFMSTKMKYLFKFQNNKFQNSIKSQKADTKTCFYNILKYYFEIKLFGVGDLDNSKDFIQPCKYPHWTDAIKPSLQQCHWLFIIFFRHSFSLFYGNCICHKLCIWNVFCSFAV